MLYLRKNLNDREFNRFVPEREAMENLNSTGIGCRQMMGSCHKQEVPGSRQFSRPPKEVETDSLSRSSAGNLLTAVHAPQLILLKCFTVSLNTGVACTDFTVSRPSSANAEHAAQHQHHCL
jgi:hypothetical protein